MTLEAPGSRGATALPPTVVRPAAFEHDRRSTARAPALTAATTLRNRGCWLSSRSSVIAVSSPRSPAAASRRPCPGARRCTSYCTFRRVDDRRARPSSILRPLAQPRSMNAANVPLDLFSRTTAGHVEPGRASASLHQRRSEPRRRSRPSDAPAPRRAARAPVAARRARSSWIRRARWPSFWRRAAAIGPAVQHSAQSGRCRAAAHEGTRPRIATQPGRASKRFSVRPPGAIGRPALNLPGGPTDGATRKPRGGIRLDSATSPLPSDPLAASHFMRPDEGRLPYAAAR